MAKAARATISDVAKAARPAKPAFHVILTARSICFPTTCYHVLKKPLPNSTDRPSLMARGLKHGRTRLIGLIIADTTNPTRSTS